MRLSRMISHRELYFSPSVLILSVVLCSHTSLTTAGSGIQWARRRHTPERLDTITTRNNIRRWTTRIYVIRRTHSSDLAQPHPGKNGEETGNKIVDARNVTNRYDMIVVYDYFHHHYHPTLTEMSSSSGWNQTCRSVVFIESTPFERIPACFALCMMSIYSSYKRKRVYARSRTIFVGIAVTDLFHPNNSISELSYKRDETSNSV